MNWLAENSHREAQSHAHVGRMSVEACSSMDLPLSFNKLVLSYSLTMITPLLQE